MRAYRLTLGDKWFAARHRGRHHGTVMLHPFRGGVVLACACGARRVSRRSS